MDKDVDFRVNSEKCTGCNLCQLACSLINQQAYSFADAFISVSRLKDERYEVEFLPSCTSCGFCLTYCAYEAIEGPFEVPCTHACPAAIDMPHYFRQVTRENFEEALLTIQENNPFPAITGRVCLHPCEPQCWLDMAEEGEAISIKALERFVAHQNSPGPAEPAAEPSGKRVAIVGSGPAGLSAAYYLTKHLGHSVTIFEALPEAGGMLRVGIPTYRLPRDILNQEIEKIKSLGVEIKTSTRVQSLDELFQQGYHAIFLALGAHQEMKLAITGEEGPGVTDCLSFLGKVNQGTKVDVGQKVVIIGGGNSAVHAARAARRLGTPEVTILYRSQSRDMPAHGDAVQEALREGVVIQELAMPTGVSREDTRIKLECIRTRSGERQADGRRRSVPVEGSQFVIEANTVIVAVGEKPQLPAQLGLPVTDNGTLIVNTTTLATGRDGVFAGGDVVTGPATVADAIGAGKRAALSIDRYLGGKAELKTGPGPDERELTVPETKDGLRRPEVPTIPLAERLAAFTEVDLELARALAVEESRRCLWCVERTQDHQHTSNSNVNLP